MPAPQHAAQPRDLLFATFQGGGNLPPVITAAAALIARGHRVRVMSDQCDRAEAEAVGAGFVPWCRAPSRPDRSAATDVMRDWEAGSPAEGLARFRDAIMAGPALAYAQDLAEELDRHPADLVVASDLVLGPLVACEARGQPVAVLAANLSLLPIPGIPPFGPGFRPARDAAEAAQQAEAAAGAEALFDGGLPALNAARAAFGLAPLARLLDQFAVAERFLLATARAFDFPATRLPGHVRYVGPLLGEPGWTAPWTSPWPADETRPLVLISFSTTFQDQAAAVQRTLDAIGQLPQLRALVTVGPGLDGAATLHAPANAVLRASAPHGVVMRQASAVVTHAGHGTVMRALAHRVPLLCLPMGRDQNDNAVRVEAHGAGLALSPATATPAEIAGALRRLIEEPSFRAAAAWLGAAVAAEAEPRRLVAELETLAAGGPLRAAA